VPKIDDFGEVVQDSEIMENCDLFEDKSVYLHITREKDRYFEFVNAKDSSNAFYVLFREWDPESWSFGPVIEVKVDK